jgi:secreted PhoX family phosphatase
MNDLSSIIEKRYSRRSVLKGFSATALFSMLPACSITKSLATTPPLFSFKELSHSTAIDLEVPKNYTASVLLKWNDKIGDNISFGYNNDFIAYMPINNSSSHGLLCVNHEYPNPELMFEGINKKDTKEQVSKEQAEIELKAVGHSIVEVKKENGKWTYVENSPYNRRLNGFDTYIQMSGPVAGHKRLKTSKDKTGKKVAGTLSNCAGGKTPWGTVLTAEENFDMSFQGKNDSKEKENHTLYGVDKESKNSWYKYFDRFDVGKEPNEPNRFGWVVELNPYDPKSTPKKRTALGRFKHEGATFVLASDGRAVIYMGDDEQFQYLYKFVSKDAYNNESFNHNLLDEGILYVARFFESGELKWLPLVYGESQLNKDNNFHSQADVLIETRRAAKLLQATQMDRPEDVETNNTNGKVYVCLTNNKLRKEPNSANPRIENKHGHIIELTPDNKDHASTAFTWDIFLLADGKKLSSPDNIAFDNKGNIWIATDGMAKTMQVNDGVYVSATQGEDRGVLKHFFNAPKGAEVCGPEFTPDNTTFFVAIQHPAEGSDLSNPSTRWPEFNQSEPPKPAIVAITKNDGGVVGQ